MASGFIIFKDGRCFARRWTGYDEIIRMAITELESIDNGLKLSDWLKSIIPSPKDDESSDAGWGFLSSKTDNWINRELDLRSLTPENYELFWKAIQNSKINLINKGVDYSTLNIEYFNVFYEMFELSEKGEPPMNLTDWNKIAEPCIEKNGPDWKK